MAAGCDCLIKVDGRWLQLNSDFLHRHPGGSVIEQYRYLRHFPAILSSSNADATHIFHAFHEGSQKAYKQLELFKQTKTVQLTGVDPTTQETTNLPDVNVASYDISIDQVCRSSSIDCLIQEKQIVANFERLRQQVHDEGLLDANVGFYNLKTVETLSIVALAFFLQYAGWYLLSALVLAVGWQQLGWLTHEYCHHQPMKASCDFGRSYYQILI
jgi:delta8-fatty-acid desaturase